ncbi:hypothetical protein POM88_002566 [Heracleum sosnowskyi]|uniref:Uncharacterized protein n=1 Tax=Heracleum sosnowskyi TaxID=360622 RepID=A0AAD8NC37_9APIA|nr:hypothetical protein POM88_002566 [Heracleum sosnowskyi]
MRRDKLNDKFIELGAILDPGRPPKIDKSAILIDVARMWAVLTRKHVDVEAACGLTKKPKAQIVDIDVADANNEFAAVEYVEDMYKFYKLAEVWSLKNTLAMEIVII